MVLARGYTRPWDCFFLRAETFYNVASYVEELGGNTASAFGERSLHEQSHGESFFALFRERFRGHGLYLLDEPEGALSTQNCLTCLRRVHELVSDGSQFIIATHSPLVLAYPHATIYNCTEHGVEEVAYEDAEPVRLTQSFLDARERFLEQLLSD